VGSLVGQLAKNVFGCTVVGSAGGPEKCAYVCATFGFDHCIDYKTCTSTRELVKALRKVSPEGIDMYAFSQPSLLTNFGCFHGEWRTSIISRLNTSWEYVLAFAERRTDGLIV
jgi:hypothetical protein